MMEFVNVYSVIYIVTVNNMTQTLKKNKLITYKQ